MKILMILDHEFPPDIRVEKEIRTLTEQGYKVHLACFTRKGKPAYEEYENYTIHRKVISDFHYKSSVAALKFPFYFNFWRKFIQKLKFEYHFDAVHVHDLPLAKVGLEMKKKFNIKFILDLHENWPALLSISEHTKTFLGRLLSSEKQWRAYEVHMSNAADYIVVVAAEMRERMIRAGVKNKIFQVVPNTLELNSYSDIKRNLRKEVFTLFYAGGLTFHRGIQIVLEALAKLPAELPVELLVVGEGKYKSVLEKMSVQLNISEKVKFLGWQNQGKVYEYLFRSDVALIPHLKTEHSDNTSPNKIFQYMQAAIPVLATNCNYLENVINSCSSGLIYEHENANDLAEKISILYHDRGLCTTLGENGARAVIEEYHWEKTVLPLIDLYQSLEVD